MPTKIHCAQCNAALNVPDNLLGKTLRCPRCQGHVKTEAPAIELELASVEEESPAAPQSGEPEPAEPRRKKRKKKKREGLLARLGSPAIGTKATLALILAGLVSLVVVGVFGFLCAGVLFRPPAVPEIPDDQWQTVEVGGCRALLPGTP